MPAMCRLVLSDDQRAELERARDRHPKPYVRERAAAVLAVADGRSLRDVGARGPLRRRRWETVSAWVARFLAEGAAGLLVRPGRGRKPRFFRLGQDRGGDPGGAAAKAAPLVRA